MSTVYWGSEHIRHTAALGNGSARGIERASGFADYDDFEDCTRSNSDKSNPDAYCGEIKHRTEDKESARRVAAGDWVETPSPVGTKWTLDMGSFYANVREEGGDAYSWRVITPQGMVVTQGMSTGLQQAKDEAYTQATVAITSGGAIRATTVSPVSQAPQIGEEYDGPTVQVESPDDAGFADARAARRRKVAGYSESNWREYPGGMMGADGSEVYADYEDALYPNENPRARVLVEDNYGDNEYVVEVMDGSGQIVSEETAYDPAEAKRMADKLLQKLYKGEGKLDPDQGKFFTTPGKGKLFSNRTASLWDQVTPPRHHVAGWNWDHAIEGFVAESNTADFACICGSNVEAPGHTRCVCGKAWNSYTIATKDGVRLVCREVPVRDGVLLARRLLP